MQAFHNDPKIKAKYIARVKAHRIADNLIQRETWTGSKGCAIGCTLEAYDHARYPIELGIPEWLARAEDRIFEGLSVKESKKWPERFLKAINTGADLEAAKAPFLIFVLESTLDKFDHKKFPDVKKAIDGSISLWKRQDIGSPSWNEAARAEVWAASRAESRAAWAAWASWAASRAAWAVWAVWAVWAAEPAWAASWASWAAYSKFADKLIEILEGIKPIKKRTKK